MQTASYIPKPNSAFKIFYKSNISDIAFDFTFAIVRYFWKL